MAPWTTSTQPISNGRSGTVKTLKEMHKLARDGAADPVVIRAAQSAVRRATERSDRATCQALLDNVKRRMRYTPDPLDVELVKSPRFMVEQSDLHGIEPMDCDDASTLLASMLGAVGIKSSFTVVSADGSRPKEWSHVYVTAQTKDGPIPLDPIVRKYQAGDQVPDDKLYGPRVNYDGGNMRGLGCNGCNGTPRMAPRWRNRGVGGLGFGPAPIGVMAKYGTEQRVIAANGGGFINDAGQFIQKAAAAGTDAYTKLLEARAKLRGTQPVAPLRVKLPKPAAPSGSFFKNPDGTTNVYAVGGTVVAVGLLAWIVTSSMRGRK